MPRLFGGCGMGSLATPTLVLEPWPEPVLEPAWESLVGPPGASDGR